MDEKTLFTQWSEWNAAYPSDTNRRIDYFVRRGAETRIRYEGSRTTVEVWATPEVATQLKTDARDNLMRQLHSKDMYHNLTTWRQIHAECCANEHMLDAYLSGDERAIGKLDGCSR